MAIRAVIGFEHLPQGVTSWINYATHGMTRGADLSAQNTLVNGWIVSNATASGSERVSIPLDPYLVAPVNKIWFGYRCRIILNARGGAGLVYIGGNYVLLDTLIPVSGNTVYLEFSYDVTTGVVERWINGVKIANTAAGTGRSMTLGLEAKGSLNGRYDYRDFYICDDQGAAQGLPVGPQGPQQVVPISIDAATGADWTTTPGGTALVDAVYEAGSIPTDKIATSNTTTKGPLAASLKVTLPAGTVVTALEVVVGVSSNGAGPVTCTSKIKNGADEVVGKTFSGPSGSYSYNGSGGVFHKNPAGGSWDSASIDATDFIVTPDA
jgi:hypothetical protein